MLFSSVTFIYVFLPILLLFYYIMPNKVRNFVLLIFSLLFYFLGEPKYIIILLLSCIINYIFGKILQNNKSRLLLILNIIYNVGQLLIFKYTDFFIGNVNNLFNTSFSLLRIVMPIGISFFTFQALSYVIDIYNNKHKSAKNIFEFMTYISLFPQLIAGPIVRYITVQDEFHNRETNYKNFSNGVKRFVIGLSKKVLLANVLGEFIELCITNTIIASWLRPIAFTLQIYFDFSGYSDMAIGLGLMFGFHFLENFNYPFIAQSITDFWRRWHISLSSWFRDYVYIPLGGNRVSKFKWIRNIFIVWFLTGFWHGASWNFILWGLYFGVILLIEKLFLGKFLAKTKVIKHVYTILIVIISFLIFSNDNLVDIGHNFRNMFGFNNISLIDKQTIYYLRSYIVIFIISIIASTPLLKNIVTNISKTKFKLVIDILEPIVYIILLILCTSFLIDNSFNPFLYFRF